MAADVSQTIVATRPINPAQPIRSIPTIRRAVSCAALMAGDAMVSVAAGAVGTAMPGWLDIAREPIVLPISPIAIVPVFLLLGLYAEWGLGPVERLRIRGISLSLYVAGSAILAASGGTLSFPIAAGLLVTAVLGFSAGHYVEDALRRILARWGHWGVSTALIGEERAIRDLARTLDAHPEFGLKPVGLIPTTSKVPGNVAQVWPAPFPDLGDLSDADGRSPAAEVAIVLDGQAQSSHLMRLPFRHVVIVPGAQAGGACMRIRSLGPAIGFDLRRDIYRRSSLALKRGVDLALALPMLLVVAPIILLLAASIKLLSPGPAFFRQVRVGHHGQTFEVLKLRTMYVDAARRLEDHLARDPAAREEWSRFYKLREDPRILPGVGQLMRRASLDELPQLINIVLGQMSLVGPRPFPEYHLTAFDDEFRALRASVPPGLTGFWQISSRSDGDTATQQLQDSYYIMNWSLWLDLYVILRTPAAILAGVGAR